MPKNEKRTRRGKQKIWVHNPKQVLRSGWQAIGGLHRNENALKVSAEHSHSFSASFD